MIYSIDFKGRRYRVEIVPEGVVIDGKSYRTSLHRFDDSPSQVLELEGQRVPVVIEPDGDRKWIVSIFGDRREAEVIDERLARARRASAGSSPPRALRPLLAPMPGLVVAVPVGAGEEVSEGASLVVLEAMKMENDLKAQGRAIVERVHVQPGQPVEKGDLLISFRESPPSA